MKIVDILLPQSLLLCWFEVEKSGKKSEKKLDFSVHKINLTKPT